MKRCWLKVWLSVLCAGLAVSASYGQELERTQAVQEFEALKSKLATLEKPLLAVSAEDTVAFAEFLKQPDSGLIRLLPREKYDARLEIRGGGAYYSFTRLKHEYGRGSDIELSQEQFSVGFAGFNFGFLLALGDKPLEELTVDTSELRFLLEFKPPQIEPEIRAIQMQSGRGVEANGLTYKSYLPAKAGRTYALRSVDYENSDVLVGFRVVRQDTDGSMILLWKMLHKFPVPKALRERGN